MRKYTYGLNEGFELILDIVSNNDNAKRLCQKKQYRKNYIYKSLQMVGSTTTKFLSIKIEYISTNVGSKPCRLYIIILPCVEKET